jgi:Ca2+-transporting ATPase
MVTGDGLLTAKAVAQEVGLLASGEDYQVIEGSEAEKLSREELIAKVPQITVYSRVNPETKLRIVEAWQARDEVVAMTGDGVNDAPALRKADIGIAMGIRGTDVTKGAADMVLADDNFATIVNAVEEGRRIFDNIKKFIHYLLSCNTGEILTLFLAVILLLPIPLLPIQILWVNLVTDGLPALALGIDPPRRDLMQQNIKKRSNQILSTNRWIRIVIQGSMIGLVTLAGFLYEYFVQGGTYSESQTIAFTVLVFSQLLHSLSCRDQNKPFFSRGILDNSWLILTFFGSILIHVGIIYIPFAQIIFNTYPLTIADWGLTAGLALLPFVINESLKLVWKFEEQ